MTAVDLRGRVALVTGAAHGLGRAISTCLGEAGASGIGFDIEPGEKGLPAGWIEHRGDVVRETDVAGAVARARDRFGRLDIVVANAGLVPPWRETEHLDFEEWDTVFAVNVKGVAATIKHAVPLMKRTGGSIVVMGSQNSRRAHPRMCLYVATKHAVLGIVRAMAMDLGRYGIRVNALGPGPVATDALLGRLQARAQGSEPPAVEVLEQFARDTSLGRIATEEDVARAALYLASDLSDGMTGQILPVDGGLP